MRIVSEEKAGTEFRRRTVPMAGLFVPEHVISIITDHADSGLAADKEVMGLIVGNVYHDDRGEYAVVRRAVTTDLVSDEKSVRFDRDGLEKLFSTIGLKEDERIVGWYHSHLDAGCIMSPTDIKTQDGLFNGECGFAIVIDPVRQELMVFDGNPGDPHQADMVIIESD